MSDYKIVKNAAGELVCYGPNTQSYEPTLKTGETLTIETKAVAEVLIKDLEAKNKAVADAEAAAFIKDRADGLAKLEAAGLTPGQARAVARKEK